MSARELGTAVTASNGGAVVFEAREMFRRYPGTTALKGVNFRVYRNQVNVLIGENGAGKSTLMRILAGAESATSGQLFLEGKATVLSDIRAATRHGIAMVHQELNVLPNLTVSDNIFAGREIRNHFGFIPYAQQRERSAEALLRLGSRISPDTLAGTLPLGQQQIVELARCLAHNSSILILDEPTSALSSVECERLFEIVQDLKRHGVSIVYISHRLQEMLHLGDHFTVLRDGRVAGEGKRQDVDRPWIVERMTGRQAQESKAVRAPAAANPDLLSTQNLTLYGERSTRTHPILDRVNLRLGAGQILGIYGLLGSGRTELMETLAGVRSAAGGQMLLHGKPRRFASVADAMRNGVVLVPEDRKRDALVPDLSIRENMSLASVQRFGWCFVSRREENKRVRQLAKDLRIKASDLELPVSSLSGGNQQKVILARCLMCDPVLLLLDEPTRGVDVGAKAEIYEILGELAAKGLGVIFTSSEIDEIRRLAQRVAVLSRGAIVDECEVAAASEERLFSSASGIEVSERKE